MRKYKKTRDTKRSFQHENQKGECTLTIGLICNWHLRFSLAGDVFQKREEMKEEFVVSFCYLKSLLEIQNTAANEWITVEWLLEIVQKCNQESKFKAFFAKGGVLER
ncbi:uncharacterized protein LOC143157485 [Aptenodytes patagonicus]|uniref:uncharacterized protein LOC143157485 n=1 Tax=Aptenodytes patagonicus TaxID=9234 RepID=UPI003FA14C13